MDLPRRRLLQLAGAALAATAVTPAARAQNYPARPVRAIVAASAGGATDIIARIIAQKLSESFGHQFYVENLPTGSGNVGMGIAAKAPPDGYTLLVFSTNFLINPSLYAKVPYDPVRDFAPVTLVATTPHILVVHPSIPATTIAELVALVRASPGRYTYASPGAGQSAQLAAELFRLSLALDLTHVPFNGAGPALTSTVGGHTPIAFLAVPVVAQNVQEGALRALAVTSSRRSAVLPDVPTLAEAGLPDQETLLMQGIVVPAGTPRDIIDRLYGEVARIVALPDIRERFAAIGFDPVANPPDAFGAQIKADVARWGKVIQDAGIKKIE